MAQPLSNALQNSTKWNVFESGFPLRQLLLFIPLLITALLRETPSVSTYSLSPVSNILKKILSLWPLLGPLLTVLVFSFLV